MMNHESPSISETTKPMYLKIWHSEIVFSDAIWWRHNKSNMADSRHIANRLLAISPRFIVRLTRNFDMKKQYYVQILVTWAKYQNLKIQDDGRQPFWKWFHHYIWAAIIRFQWNFVCRCIVCFQERSHIKVSKFCKFKMAYGHFVSDYMSALVGALS